MFRGTPFDVARTTVSGFGYGWSFTFREYFGLGGKYARPANASRRDQGIGDCGCSLKKWSFSRRSISSCFAYSEPEDTAGAMRPARRRREIKLRRFAAQRDVRSPFARAISSTSADVRCAGLIIVSAAAAMLAAAARFCWMTAVFTSSAANLHFVRE